MSDIYRNILQNFRAVRRSQAAVNDILDDWENEVVSPLHLRARADGVAKKPDDYGKDRLTEVLEHREVGSNTYQALQRTTQGLCYGQTLNGLYYTHTHTYWAVQVKTCSYWWFMGYLEARGLVIWCGSSLRSIPRTSWLRSGTPQ